MSDRRQDEGFLGRWSRLKTDAREAPAQPPAAATAPVQAVAKTDDAPPELPPVESLTIDSDFRGFLHPKVDEDLRRSALRKLFSDPHFNVMDGLDVYIDDYSVSEPIPPEMLASLKQAQRIVRWAAGHDDEEATPEPEAEEAETAASSAPDDAPAAIESAASDDTPADPNPIVEPVPQAVVKPA